MKHLMYLMLAAFLISLSACSDDEPAVMSTKGENNSSVTIKRDGKTSTGANFIQVSSDSFYLDCILYKIVDTHLEIVGYDSAEIEEFVKPYATVVYQGVTYKTRVIQQKAFYGCNKIVKMHIPNTITQIEDNAFDWCVNLEEANIPNGVKSIGRFAFERTGIKEVTIPSSVTEIRSEAFEECYYLERVNISDLSAWCKINFYDNLSNPLSYSTSRFYVNGKEIKDLVIPKDITEINSNAFCSRSFTSITIPEGVVRIGRNAFCDIGAISITIPKSVVYIGPYALASYSLTEIHVKNPKPTKINYYDGDIAVYSTTTLYVPKGTSEAYRTATGWSNFKNIIEE